VIGHGVQLYRTSALASVVFEPAVGGVESVADRDMRILMRVVRTAVAADDNLGAGNGEIDVDLKDVALLVPPAAGFDDNPAGGDPVEELVELFGALPYSRFERRRGFHVAKGDLERQLHRMSPADDQINLGKNAETEIDPAQFERRCAARHTARNARRCLFAD
jgi:hypothetical protein